MVSDEGFPALRVPIQKDEFGILSTNFDDGSGGGIIMTGGLSLRDYFIDIRHVKDVAH